MIKFMHFSDTHLGLKMTNRSFGLEYAEERRKSIWDTLKRAIDYAVDNKVDYILIPGDVFEREYFTLGDGNRLKEIFSISEDVQILIAAGNHDYIEKNSIYTQIKWPQNVHIFQSNGIDIIEFKEKNTAIFGYSWDSIEKKDEFNLYKDDFMTDCNNKILLLHTDTDKTSEYLPVDLSKLNEFEIDYTALGHIHKPEIINDRMAYSGCLEPTHFKEVGSRGFILGEIDGEDIKLEFIPFSKREFITKTISINENLGYEDIISKVEDIFTEEDRMRNFYRIKLKGYYQSDIDKKSLFIDITDMFYYIEIQDEMTPDYDLVSLERDFEEGIIGNFIKEMKNKDISNPKVKEALYIGLDALLKGRV